MEIGKWHLVCLLNWQTWLHYIHHCILYQSSLFDNLKLKYDRKKYTSCLLVEISRLFCHKNQKNWFNYFFEIHEIWRQSKRLLEIEFDACYYLRIVLYCKRRVNNLSINKNPFMTIEDLLWKSVIVLQMILHFWGFRAGF